MSKRSETMLPAGQRRRRLIAAVAFLVTSVALIVLTFVSRPTPVPNVGVSGASSSGAPAESTSPLQTVAPDGAGFEIGIPREWAEEPASVPFAHRYGPLTVLVADEAGAVRICAVPQGWENCAPFEADSVDDLADAISREWEFRVPTCGWPSFDYECVSGSREDMNETHAPTITVDELTLDGTDAALVYVRVPAFRDHGSQDVVYVMVMRDGRAGVLRCDLQPGDVLDDVLASFRWIHPPAAGR